jgi:hypothetical protein
MAPELYEMLLSRVKAHGYDLDRLQQTPQPILSSYLSLSETH